MGGFFLSSYFSIIGLFQKKFRRVVESFFSKNPWIFRFVILSLEILEKTKLHLKNFTKQALCMLFHIEGATCFKKGQLQGGLKQLNLEQIPGVKKQINIYIIYVNHIYHIYIFIYTIKCWVSTKLHFLFGVWVLLSSTFSKLSGEACISNVHFWNKTCLLLQLTLIQLTLVYLLAFYK